MNYKSSHIARCFCYLLMLVIALDLTGCCGYKGGKKQSGKSSKTRTASSSKKSKSIVSSNAFEQSDGLVVSPTADIELKAQDERTTELYEKMDYANKMFKNENYDGALREVERIQREIDDDPYLEMQTWCMAAMIYDKTGKTSRRKRSYNKMLECMEKVQLDKRYKSAFEDGKLCKEYVELALEKGNKNYAEE